MYLLFHEDVGKGIQLSCSIRTCACQDKARCLSWPTHNKININYKRKRKDLRKLLQEPKNVNMVKLSELATINVYSLSLKEKLLHEKKIQTSGYLIWGANTEALLHTARRMTQVVQTRD